MSETSDRIGNRILMIVAKHALKMVPVAGPYLEFGADVLEAILKESSQELAGSLLSDHLLTISELVEYLKRLPPQEVVTTIDAMFNSPESVQQLSSLSTFEKAQLRAKLINIPSDVDSIIHKVLVQKPAQSFLEMRGRLLTMIESEAWDDAASLSQDMLKIVPNDIDTIKLESLIAQKGGRPVTFVWDNIKYTKCLYVSFTIWIIFLFISYIFGYKILAGIIVLLLVPGALLTSVIYWAYLSNTYYLQWPKLSTNSKEQWRSSFYIK